MLRETYSTTLKLFTLGVQGNFCFFRCEIRLESPGKKCNCLVHSGLRKLYDGSLNCM